MAAPTQPNPAVVPAPTTDSAPSPSTPSELTWVYPFRDADLKEVVDPQKFHEALSYMDDGFFPLGVNGFPHGGIHFGNATAARLDQSGGMRCIADGEIVAYRVNTAYEHLRYADGKWAAYSTGFVLVRHHMTMPPAPDSTGPQPLDETHNVYSLYMHMADWNMYLADMKLPRPFWWDVDAFAVLGKDRQHPPPEGGAAGATGAFVWTEPKAGKKKGRFTAGDQVGFLPEGSEVIVSEKRGEWAHIKTITAGAMCSATSGDYFGWEDKSVPWVVPDGMDTDPANSAAMKPPVTSEGDWGWLHMPGLQGTKEPKQIGQVFIPNPPIRVNAQTLLGQLGEYQDYERANLLPPKERRRLLHLEVFADEGFSAFLLKCRARAAQLDAAQKTLLVINEGAKLVQDVPPADRKLGHGNPVSMAEPTEDSPVSGPWVKVQPRRLSQGVMHMPDGPPVWIARENLLNPTGNTPAWSQFPLKLQDAATAANGFPLVYSRVQLDALDGHSKAVDDRRVLWWRITFCKPDGEKARGWVCGTGHPNTKWESPWAWPGFEIVDATGINLADAFKRNLIITDSASWKEKKEFEPFAATVNNSPLLLKLEELVARQQPSTPGGKQTDEQHSKVTAKAIQASMRMPALAQALSHVILKYESEWGGNMSRWDAITPIMRNAKANWMKELERVGKLQWWKEVEGRVEGFPVGAIVHHIHPVALVANFGGCPAACKTEVFEFKTTEGIFRVSKKSFRFILSNEGYRDYPYVPSGDQSSGVTIGYGYDLGQQSSIQIANDLNGIFSLAQIIRLQSAVGKHGDQARHIQPSLADIRVTMDMALRLAMIMKRRYAQQTVDAFPGVAGLHPHCSGALLDLVINRGPGMQDKPGQKTRSHMRAIRAGIGENRLAGVPLQLRAMKTLWDPVTQGGLLTRRDAEADLFEQGMNCCCWS